MSHLHELELSRTKALVKEILIQRRTVSALECDLENETDRLDRLEEDLSKANAEK